MICGRQAGRQRTCPGRPGAPWMVIVSITMQQPAEQAGRADRGCPWLLAALQYLRIGPPLSQVIRSEARAPRAVERDHIGAGRSSGLGPPSSEAPRVAQSARGDAQRVRVRRNSGSASSSGLTVAAGRRRPAAGLAEVSSAACQSTWSSRRTSAVRAQRARRSANLLAAEGVGPGARPHWRARPARRGKRSAENRSRSGWRCCRRWLRPVKRLSRCAGTCHLPLS